MNAFDLREISYQYHVWLSGTEGNTLNNLP